MAMVGADSSSLLADSGPMTEDWWPLDAVVLLQVLLLLHPMNWANSHNDFAMTTWSTNIFIARQYTDARY